LIGKIVIIVGAIIYCVVVAIASL